MRITFIFLLTIFLHQNAFGQTRLYVGTYNQRNSQGIYVFEWNETDGGTKLLQTIGPLKSPNFLNFHPSGKILYSVNGESITDNKKHGSTSAFEVKTDGKLRLLNNASTKAQGACHVKVDATGKMLFAANYSGSQMTMIALKENGQLSDRSKEFTYQGSGPNKQRQEKSHPHSVIISPDNRFAYVPDLGMDKIHAYRIKAKKQKLKPAKVPSTSTHPGGGPRHFIFHQDGKHAFLAEELSNHVSMFRYNRKNGKLEFIQRLSTLPDDFQDFSKNADLHLHPNGKWLYVSNRGHESLAIYEVDIANEKMKLKGYEKVRGVHPRNFMISPSGKYLLVANRDTDNVVIFTIDASSGLLNFTGKEISIPAPVCLKMK